MRFEKIIVPSNDFSWFSTCWNSILIFKRNQSTYACIIHPKYLSFPNYHRLSQNKCDIQIFTINQNRQSQNICHTKIFTIKNNRRSQNICRNQIFSINQNCRFSTETFSRLLFSQEWVRIHSVLILVAKEHFLSSVVLNHGRERTDSLKIVCHRSTRYSQYSITGSLKRSVTPK